MLNAIKHHGRRCLTALLVCGSLAACGGASDADPAAPQAESATGSVTGFGSLIVEGKTYADAQATVRIETDPAAPASAALGDVKLGMQVEVEATGSEATAVTVVATVIGTITRLQADGFIAAGQTIRVVTDAATPTLFEGARSLADLASGDFVEVHGDRDEAGAVVATRIERKDPRSPRVVRVIGTVAQYDAGARTFRLGGLTVALSTTTRLLPATAVLADGVPVAVWSGTPPVGDRLDAATIRVRRQAPADGSALRIGGLVRRLDFAARRFVVDGLPVDAATAVFRNGTASDLANGRRVRVVGNWSNGLLRATDVRFPHPQGDEAVALTGAITDFAGAASFKVRGVPVDASATTVRFVGGDASNLGDGVVVRIDGQVVGDVVKPTVVAFPSTAADATRRLVGTAGAVDLAAGTFRLLGATMRLAPDAVFLNADRSPAQRADLADGDRVRLRVRFAAGQATVTELTFLDGPTLVVNRVDGVATDVQASIGVFRLNGLIVRTDTSTSWSGERVNLRNGVHVRVEGSVVDGALVSRIVEIQDADDASRIRAVGTIGSFATIAAFEVAGQKIDASRAIIVGGTAQALGDGDFVEVRGPVVDGVVVATVLRLR